MSGVGREERYEPLREPVPSSDGSYKPHWDNLESQQTRAPPPVIITLRYKIYVACVVLCDVGFIAIASVVLSTGKSWDKFSTSDKLWLIIAPVYTVATILVVGVFTRAWQKSRRINRA